MKRIVNSLQKASLLSPALWPMLIAYGLLPALVLAAFGLVFIVQQGYLLPFVGLLALCTLVPVLQVAWRNHRQVKVDPEAGDNNTNEKADENALVAPSADWSTHDHQVWSQLNQTIVQQLDEKSDWGDLKEHGLALISLAAIEYDRQLLSFSVPEMLKMTEEISRRYRKVLLTHVPYAEKIQWSALKQVYDKREHIETGKQYGKTLFNAYRVARIANPVSMLISELRGALLNQAFGTVSSKLQYKLKQAFLQEVVSVAIDLYSGRFKIDDDRLGSTQAAHEDRQRMETPLDPIRVCLIGQVSSGKSSVVNALKKSLAAETNPLPATDTARVYPCQVEGIDLVHLVDLPGLDGSAATEQQLLKHATEANIILWVLKANQPARALDVQFKAKLDAYYAEPANRSKKAPVIIGVLNQVDRLKPVAEWRPPYDLDTPQTAKARTICAALDHNRELLGLSLLPLSVSDDKTHFNLDALEKQLDAQYADARNVQLNQMRVQAGDGFELSDQLQRVYQSGKSLFAMVRR